MTQDSPEGPSAERVGSAETSPLAASMAEAARRAGFGELSDGGRVSGRGVLAAIGGIRGLAEAILPGVLFLVLYTFTASLPLSLGVSVGIAALFTALRLLARTPVAQAVGGLVAVGASAVLALITKRPEDNFVLGLLTNAVYGGVLLISVLVRWPLVGVAVGFLMGDGTAWRQNRRKFRALTGLTLIWVALFVARLAVQLPLYFASNVELLGTLKLLMGLPLYAPVLVVSWLVVRALYAGRDANGPIGQH